MAFTVCFFSSCSGLPATIETGESKPLLGLTPNKDTYPLSRFPDIPFPSRFKYDRSRSFIYESGSGLVKVARLVFHGWPSQENTITFFENEMINNGWTLVRGIEHSDTMLLYQKEDRVCTIIVSSTLGQTTFEIQIGPK